MDNLLGNLQKHVKSSSSFNKGTQVPRFFNFKKQLNQSNYVHDKKIEIEIYKRKLTILIRCSWKKTGGEREKRILTMHVSSDYVITHII